MKYISNNIVLDNQVPVESQHGDFRMDFVLSHGNRRIAIECDGRDFHEPFRDEFRDAILLGEGHFETIYHFRGCDITYYPEDCLWLMSKLNPEIFTERSKLILNRLHRLEPILATGESYELRNRRGEAFYWFWAFRRNIHLKSHNPNWPFWKSLYSLACEHPGLGLDELIGLLFAEPERASAKKRIRYAQGSS
jgi:hypothetical protein